MNNLWTKIEFWWGVRWVRYTALFAAFLSLGFFERSRYPIEFGAGVTLFYAQMKVYYMVSSYQRMIEIDNQNLRGLHSLFEELENNTKEVRSFIENSFSDFGRGLADTKNQSAVIGLLQENINLTQAVLNAVVNSTARETEDLQNAN